ncbi:MAG: lytic transglycosylase domain-containing protein [Flavobacteriales bacterium]
MKKIVCITFCCFILSCQQQNSYSENIATQSVLKTFQSPEIPDSLSFCGKFFPMERQDIREPLDLEFIKNTYWHSNMILMLKRAHRYFPVIEPILKKEGIPDDFKYLALAESGLDPTISSPARAKGMWQFLAQTAQDYGLEVSNDVDERMHVEKATYAACQYLNDAYEKFGDWTLAAAAYNMGMNGLLKAVETQNSKDYFFMNLNPETNRYLFRIVALKYVINHPEKYGFEIKKSALYPPFQTKKITRSETVENLPDWAKEQGISYRELKFYNPWLISTKLEIKEGKSYEIHIPE